jgi:hypothetical protein
MPPTPDPTKAALIIAAIILTIVAIVGGAPQLVVIVCALVLLALVSPSYGPQSRPSRGRRRNRQAK